MTHTKERRDFFRINDIIGLSYTELTGDDEPKYPDVSGEMGLPLANLLGEVDATFNNIANTIWKEEPTVAQALGLLNRKISLLAAHIMQADGSDADSYQDIIVSLSGCGMGFHSNEALTESARLRVAVILKPSHVEVKFTATVVSCEPLPPEKKHAYWIRISIDKGNDAAQEQLIQHVVQKQYSSIAISKT
ncbi:PilZ domain-containing protein [Pseudohalioglobus lutimaris]|uniref:PilZ domain-containing protein n=1 Tax=Pseudohalioglobus lutimaris TaxID=1737061 RepID=A0A2N5X1E6_9GAMM|nr:PilZ domain-containing protein [Pseudohalioglobus lutimaris]PLW68314.1 hypothetical protein C0039_13035 [Pseudohalioglobus lutimaris]